MLEAREGVFMEGILKKFFLSASENSIIQFLRYSIVGGIAALIDIALFYIFANILLFNHLSANTTSFTAGLLVNYCLSRNWVFNSHSRRFLRDFLLFAVIGVVGLLLSNLILFLLIDAGLLSRILRFWSSNSIKLAAKLTAVFIVLFWNFIARKKLVFSIA